MFQKATAKEHQGPLHFAHPISAVFQTPVSPGFVPQHNQRYNFQRARGRADRHHRSGGAGEVKVVERSRNATQHEQRGGRQARGGCQLARYQTHGAEDKGERSCRKYLKEALYPQVHNPPAPVLHNGNVGALAVEEAGAVEQMATTDAVSNASRFLSGTMPRISATLVCVVAALGWIDFPLGIGLAALFWVLAFGLFVVLYGPVLCWPRADGRPG